MKKVLKIIGVIILLIIAIVLIGGLFTAKKYHFEKSISINASQSVVWPYIGYLQATTKWMPWMKMDPNIQSGIEGTDGTPGAKYWWKGNDKVGEGNMVINSVNPPQQTVIDLHFIKPFDSKAITTLSAQNEGNGTKVTWSMDGSNPYPLNFISKVIFNMDAMLDKDFGTGLSNLKAMCEKQ